MLRRLLWLHNTSDSGIVMQMRLIGVSAAAEQLGVSPRRVRQMLSDGVLVGQRVGRSWVIEEHALRAAAWRRPAHRPWNPSRRWAVLSLAGGIEPRCKAYERHRAACRLAVGLPNLLGRLASRAHRLNFYTHPATRDRIALQPGVVRTAASASLEHHLGIVGSGPLEAYVAHSDLLAIREVFAMEERSERANLIFRVVEDDLWPFPHEPEVAPLAVVAVDLLESEDERSRRAGADLLQRL